MASQKLDSAQSDKKLSDPWANFLTTSSLKYHLVCRELPLVKDPENFPSSSFTDCLILFVAARSQSSAVPDTVQTHIQTHKRTHIFFFFLPLPKGLVWFMPLVKVWVGLKEIMVRLSWDCGAFLNWCRLLHVHHIRPCSPEITHQRI